MDDNLVSIAGTGLLQPVVVMLFDPIAMIFNPPPAIVPVMVLVEITPFRMMLLNPGGMMPGPPLSVVPCVMLVVVADSVVFIRVRQDRHR